jgi:hypothetical protein
MLGTQLQGEELASPGFELITAAGQEALSPFVAQITGTNARSGMPIFLLHFIFFFFLVFLLERAYYKVPGEVKFGGLDTTGWVAQPNLW